MLERLHHPGLGLLILRVVVGLIFVVHGAQKVFTYGYGGVTGAFTQMNIPAPAITAAIVMAVEFVGGILLIVGLLTRWAALLLAIDMAGAILFVHLQNGFFNPKGYEYPLALFAACAALVVGGPGMAALDTMLFRRGIADRMRVA